jgi:hypothetical protein
VRVHGNVVRVPCAERRLGRAVPEEVARHPVVFAGPGEVLHLLPEVATVRLGAAFAGRADQHHREARLEGHGDEGGLAVAGDAFDAHAPRVDGGQRFEVVERARRAPGPRAQRSPLLGCPAPSLVGETDDARGEAGAVVRLDAGGAERHVAPAGGDELIGRRWSGGILHAREPEHRVAGHAAGAEHHQDRNRPLRVDGDDDRHLDVHRDRGMGGIVDVPDDSPGHDGLTADGGLHGLGDLPRDLRHVAGHTAVDLSLEVLDDLRAPLLPPQLRGRDLPAVLQGQDFGPVRIGVGLVGIVVGGAGLACDRAAVRARAQLRDAELPQHVGVVLARELVQARALLGAQQERVRGCGRGCRRRRRLGPQPRCEQQAQAGEKTDTQVVHST